jgi:Permuted papain-like amidase enzyme, YaeF/YiiX, C92 family
MGHLSGRLGLWLARYLARPVHVHSTAPATRLDSLVACLQPADVLLVEGNSRFSTAIKYLTQSTWSHAAMYVGMLPLQEGAQIEPCFVEADVEEGVRLVGIAEFTGYHTRICRASMLDDPVRAEIVTYMMNCIGYRYDLRNVIDLVRYLMPTPPVPLRMRRKLLTLGSGEPTLAICSTLVARAFQAVHYPILPIISERSADAPDCPGCVEEIYQAREASFYVPRDFDVSPYFEIVKPSLAAGFDHRGLHWLDEQATKIPNQP